MTEMVYLCTIIVKTNLNIRGQYSTYSSTYWWIFKRKLSYSDHDHVKIQTWDHVKNVFFVCLNIYSYSYLYKLLGVPYLITKVIDATLINVQIESFYRAVLDLVR